MTQQKTLDPTILAQWIGKQETLRDTIRVDPANLMEMTLDRPARLATGDALPPLWHWLYFLQSARLSELGRDGHPALGGFLPPVALPRRMWAGGRFGFNAALRIGNEAQKTSTIKDVALKQGRSGTLCFVTVRHEISNDAGLTLWEEHDIVYREDPKPDAAQPDAKTLEGEWGFSETHCMREVALFRYSALTFNGHRIHYDRDYARNVEGHEGLVVHGPLVATLLADFALRNSADLPLKVFEFRASKPLYDNGPFTLHGRADGGEQTLAVTDPAGLIAMQARAHF